MPEQLKYAVIFGVADVGKRLWFQAEVEGSPRLMRLPAVHGITAPKYHGLIMDGSHMSVRKKVRVNWELAGDPWALGPIRKPVGASKTNGAYFIIPRLRLFPQE